ncbi:MAG: serine hydrolase [Pseudomonadota bacterium]
MSRFSRFCLAALVLLHCQFAAAQAGAAASVQAAQADAALAAAIDARLAPFFRDDKPGVTVIVTRDGKPLFRKAYGLADVARRVPMEPGMSLRLGSITKQFTAVSILMLAEEGKLAIGDDIRKYLPDYPSRGKTITIEHLLTHTAGIVNYTSRPGFGRNDKHDMSVTQVIDSFKNDPLEFEPGTRFAYTNSGYFLLGAIIEKVSGMPYAQFVAQRIFVPLGMTQTAYEGHERAPAVRAAGHTRGFFGVTASDGPSMTVPYAAGALVSCVDDLARWDAALYAGTLLKSATLQKAFTSYTLADGKPTRYGYGWYLTKLQGHAAISHSGAITGFTSYALRLPDDKVYAAVLQNSDASPIEPEMVANIAASYAIGAPLLPYTPIALDAKTLDAYAGVYRINATATRTFKREGDHLLMVRANGDTKPIYAYSENGFYIDKTWVHFEFARDAQGVVDRLTLVEKGVEVDWPRIGDVPAKP